MKSSQVRRKVLILQEPGGGYTLVHQTGPDAWQEVRKAVSTLVEAIQFTTDFMMEEEE